MKLYRLLFLPAFLIASLNAYSQVTIGSSEPPLQGAILELKNIDGAVGGVNATKGLVMPRVYLVDLKRLQPMYSYADASTTPTASDLQNTIGLIVYNTNVCLDGLGGADGLYVWNGSVWLPLDNSLSNGLIVAQDQDGNSFRARRFITADGSVDAGVWMVENLRAKTFAQTGRTGIDVTILTNMPASPSSTSSYSDPQWSYPSFTGVITDATYFNSNPALGLLYSWPAATNGKGRGDAAGTNPTANTTGQGVPGFGGDGAKTQGICPNGWHLPSDAEWNLLERVIATSPQLYSYYTGTETGWNSWNPSWATILDSYRPNISNSVSSSGLGHGNAMKISCTPPQYTGPFSNTYGKSFSASRGGFAVILTGYGYPSVVDSYGYVARFWTSTSGSGGNGTTGRELFSGNAGISRPTLARNYSSSVRCKKD